MGGMTMNAIRTRFTAIAATMRIRTGVTGILKAPRLAGGDRAPLVGAS
jgi:hypothetical protein